MLLKNVQLYWVKLDPKNPDKGFGGDKPNWCVEIRTRNKAQAGEFKTAGLNVKTNDDDNGIFYSVRLSKPTHNKNGKPFDPVPVVGPDLMPLANVNSIGNGTVANVKVYQFEWEFGGKTGKSSRLDAIQVVELIEYKKEAGGNRWGFELVDDEGIPAHAFTDGPKAIKKQNNGDEVY